MAILGAIRLVLAIAEYATAYREALGSGPAAAWRLAEFLRENPPVFVLIGAWPLALGLMLLRTRWPELVKAGALTFLILSIGGVLDGDIRLGPVAPSLDRDRLVPGVAGGALAARAGRGGAGAGGRVPVAAGARHGLGAVVLAFRGKDGTGDDARAQARSVGRGWAGWPSCVSIAFLALTIRVPAGSAFLEIINQSRWIREFILRDDLARIRSTPPPRPPESRWIQDGQVLYNEAYEAWSEGRYGKARDAYLRLADMLETIPTTTMTSSERQFAALALNNTAWLLATCPDPELRDHADAVKHARRAIELEPNNGNTWNTLGVAYFRLGDWEEARSALYRSMELRNEGDSFDWFFLAMIHAQLGRKERRASGTTRRRSRRSPVGPTTPSSTDSRPRPPRRWACPSPIGPSRGPCRPPGRRSTCVRSARGAISCPTTRDRRGDESRPAASPPSAPAPRFGLTARGFPSILPPPEDSRSPTAGAIGPRPDGAGGCGPDPNGHGCHAPGSHEDRGGPGPGPGLAGTGRQPAGRRRGADRPGPSADPGRGSPGRRHPARGCPDRRPGRRPAGGPRPPPPVLRGHGPRGRSRPAAPTTRPGTAITWRSSPVPANPTGPAPAPEAPKPPQVGPQGPGTDGPQAPGKPPRPPGQS